MLVRALPTRGRRHAGGAWPSARGTGTAQACGRAHGRSAAGAGPAGRWREAAGCSSEYARGCCCRSAAGVAPGLHGLLDLLKHGAVAVDLLLVWLQALLV